MKPSTAVVHVGSEPDVSTGAVIPPIYQTSTFTRGEDKGHIYEYTRAGNPNFTRLEAAIAFLEGGRHATAFGSGLAAITAVCSLLGNNFHVVTSEDLYGGTARLLTQVFNNYGVSVSFVRAYDTTAWKVALAEKKTRLCFIESPTNPLLQIANIKEITAEARRLGVLSVVDNTFATPIFQRPLDLGADAVLHSTTKYIGGHSDIIGGVVVTNDKPFKERLDFARKAIGLNPSPFDVWLTSRGLKTLALRMERHEKNATAIAKWLVKQSAVKEVLYPGLSAHPQHGLAKRQMTGFGGMISVRFKASKKEAEKGLSRLKLFTRAESLGGVESLICHPASQTHASLSAKERECRGIGDDLWRLSVGIEDISDLIEDLNSALV